MKLSEALAYLERLAQESTEDPRLVIEVSAQGEVGATPAVDVDALLPGFDWDNGRLLLKPAKPLTALSAEDLEALRRSVRAGQSWHAYQGIKRMRAHYEEQILQLRARIAELENPWQARASDRALHG